MCGNSFIEKLSCVVISSGISTQSYTKHIMLLGFGQYYTFCTSISVSFPVCLGPHFYVLQWLTFPRCLLEIHPYMTQFSFQFVLLQSGSHLECICGSVHQVAQTCVCFQEGKSIQKEKLLMMILIFIFQRECQMVLTPN